MNTIILLFTTFFSINVFAESKSFQFASYEEAKKSENFIRFDMQSTKMGLVTTSFTGFVKNIQIDYQESESAYNNVIVQFKAKDLDTDISGRNEKMWSKCFDADKHPTLQIKIPTIAKNPGAQKVTGEIHIRGKSYPIQMDITLASAQKITGNSEMSLKGLEIPDPSIMIASVKDAIKVSFALTK